MIFFLLGIITGLLVAVLIAILWTRKEILIKKGFEKTVDYFKSKQQAIIVDMSDPVNDFFENV